jgi:hypothetical protein
MATWVGELWQHDCTHQLSLKLDIDEKKWTKILPVGGENGAHMKQKDSI